MPNISDNEFPKVLLDEQAGDPAAPSTGLWRVYAKADGLYVIDDVGAVLGPLGQGDGIDEGTSFPSSPTTGDLFRRTDLERHVYRYNGTLWLTERTFWWQGVGMNGHTTSPYDSHLPGQSPFPQPENGYYLDRFSGNAYVATTNNGSHYWKYVGPDFATVAMTTAAIAPNAYTRLDSDAAAGLYTIESCRIRYEKVGSPGALYGCVAVVCRGVGV